MTEEKQHELYEIVKERLSRDAQPIAYHLDAAFVQACRRAYVRSFILDGQPHEFTTILRYSLCGHDDMDSGGQGPRELVSVKAYCEELHEVLTLSEFLMEDSHLPFVLVVKEEQPMKYYQHYFGIYRAYFGMECLDVLVCSPGGEIKSMQAALSEAMPEPETLSEEVEAAA